jgi:hypothetical protein
MNTSIILIDVLIAGTLFGLLQVSIPQRLQESYGALEMVNVTGFDDKGEVSASYHIIGEVRNNGSMKADFVRIFVTIYNITNNTLGTDYTYLSRSTLEPGAKLPFEVVLPRDKVKGGHLSQIDHFSLNATS